MREELHKLIDELPESALESSLNDLTDTKEFYEQLAAYKPTPRPEPVEVKGRFMGVTERAPLYIEPDPYDVMIDLNIRRLFEIIEEWGGHSLSCSGIYFSSLTDKVYSCNCGWDAVEQELKEIRECLEGDKRC